ncbi:hypothetical protein M569_01554, partial [Genlisea aurea]
VRSFSSSSSNDHYRQSRGGVPRFFSQTLPSSKGGIVRVNGDEFWHMIKVLRLRINDRVELFNGKGDLVEGRIDNIDHAGVDFEALENLKSVSPHSIQCHVFAAFGSLKGGRADWLVEKCTELGASSLTPLLTERSHKIGENRIERLQRVVLASAKQCQRLHEMALKPPIGITKLLSVVGESRLSFVGVAEAAPLFHTLSSLKHDKHGVIIIGPEGDLSEEELKRVVEGGAIPCSLGPHRLRVETAAITLLSALMLWSDS